MIVKLCKQRMEEVIWLWIISAGAFLFGAVMLGVAMHFSHEGDTTFEIGTLMVAMITLFYLFFAGGYGFAKEFNLAVGMGITRKKFVPAYVITAVIINTLQMIILYISHFAEKLEIATFYSGWTQEKGIELFLFSKFVIPAIIGFAALQALIGCLYLRYGRRAFWGIWFIWMALCLLPSRIEAAMKANNNSALSKLGDVIVSTVTGVTQWQAIALIGIITVVSLIITYLLARKQQVSSL